MDRKNYALDIIKKGYVYINDDDTTIHPNLWNSIKYLDYYDMITFSQNDKDGNLRLRGNVIQLYHIDSHNFIVHNDIIKNIRYNISEIETDGVFAEQCLKNSKNKIFIDKVLSIYNKLR